MSEEKSGVKDPYKKYKEFKWSNPDVFKKMVHCQMKIENVEIYYVVYFL